ncbi:MAG: CBS domain-containing protein [Victivallaceae bacterium]|jgi:CBS domain-containing protein
MNLKQLLDQKDPVVFSIGENSSLCECIKMLNDKNIGALVVVNHENKICGIITERDVLKLTYSSPVNVCSVLVKDGMTPRDKLVTAEENDSLTKIMETMTAKRIRHIPVLKEGEVCGIVSIGDVVKFLLGVMMDENKQMKDYIAGGF